jgi:hypothetical protein
VTRCANALHTRGSETPRDGTLPSWAPPRSSVDPSVACTRPARAHVPVHSRIPSALPSRRARVADAERRVSKSCGRVSGARPRHARPTGVHTPRAISGSSQWTHPRRREPRLGHLLSAGRHCPLTITGRHILRTITRYETRPWRRAGAQGSASTGTARGAKCGLLRDSVHSPRVPAARRQRSAARLLTAQGLPLVATCSGLCFPTHRAPGSRASHRGTVRPSIERTSRCIPHSLSGS